MRYCRVVVNMRMLLQMLTNQQTVEVATGLPKDCKFVKIMSANVDVAILLVEHPMFPEAKSESEAPLMTIMFIRKGESHATDKGSARK